MKTALSLAALLALGGSALAHSTLETTSATAGSSYKAVVKVPHGCDGKPTNAVKVTLPAGLYGAKPMPKAGWALDIAKGPYAKPYTSHGKTYAEGPTAITWSGGNLGDDQYDEFVFQASVGEDIAPGTKLYVPIEQTCPGGASARWVEIPKAEGEKLKSPAPFVTVAQASGGHGGHDHGAMAMAPAPLKAGDVTLDNIWARATPNGAQVAGGFVTLKNTGTSADRLVSASSPAADHLEIHEMAVENNVMRMRELPKGLELAPGASVELKPGSYHIMFMGLKTPLKEGDKVKGQLTFEKGGKVDVEFEVRGLAAQGGPSGGMNQGQHKH